MRAAFIEQLTALAETDERIIFLSMDLGFAVVEPFRDRHPGRFWNTGVCEQSTLAMATGLAEEGFIPFVYSIATFATARPYEFIRNGAALHDFPVRIVGVGGGFEYGTAGPTHHACDDIGLMRMLPEMTIIAPADYRQASAALKATWDLPGPVYYRIGKHEKYEAPGLDGRFDLGDCQVVKEGREVCLIALGSMLREALLAAETLEAGGVSVAVLCLASVSPFPEESVRRWLCRVPLTVTLETHHAAGGIGEAVAALAADDPGAGRVNGLCVRKRWDGLCGSETFLLKQQGLTGEQVAAHICDLLGKASA